MFRKYTSDQNIVMCWRMLNSRAYRMAGASDCMSAQAHSLAICPGAFNKIPGFFMSRDLPQANAR